MNWLNFNESIEYLKKNKISVLETKIINSKKELEKYSNFPYVLKLSSNLIHKTESKAIITDIYSKESLESSFDYLQNVLKKEKVIGKVILQKQVKGLELIVGINEDPQFGKVIVFGQGGIYTEIQNDTAIRILPITKKEIEEMIFQTRVSKLFFARGIQYDVSKLIFLVEQVSILSKDKDLLELDLNPVIFTKDNFYIVDARVKLK
ncbi:MAG: acetate--CoA ligase family protein [archaeon]|jgi:hypothetical protein